MSDEEHFRVRRQAQLATLDKLVGKVMAEGQLFLMCLVDGLGEGGWSASSNAAAPVLVRLLETILAERTGRTDDDGSSEPRPDTLSKLHGQYRKLDVQPTEILRQQMRKSLDAVAQAVLRNDSIAEATLLVYHAACSLVLYRRAVLAFIETRKSKGGTA